MVEGTGLSLYMLIGAIMFGLFAGATAIFGEEVGSFVGGLVETVKELEPNEAVDNAGEDPNCVLATDEDFIGTVNGDFMYIGSSDCVKIPHVIKGVEVSSYQNMFNGTSVSKVVSDNPNVTDMSNMFHESKATVLDVSRLNTSKVTTMTYMFYGSQAAEIKGLENLNTSNVTNMTHMFKNTKATELDVSNFDTSNVTTMWDMFYYSQATEIKGIENFNTSNVTNMWSMFNNSKATVIDVSNFDTSNVTNMRGLFYYSQATEIKGLENFNTSNVINMRRMFTNSKATVLDLSSFDTSKVTNMWQMFMSSQATELDLSSFDTSNVTITSEMFYESVTKIVYARTQVDADKYNASINKPIGLQVVVKQ